MDTARIDGAGEFQTYFYIMLPMIRPAISTLIVFQFMWNWNNFLLPLIILHQERLRTLPLGLMYFMGEFVADTTLIAAGVLIASLPIVAVYVTFQRQFIRGMTAGALKG
jgi:ABC-type glycerol-3-phosphate transport system permease component